MDIKTIAGIVGLVITIGGLFVFQGQLIQRVDVLEAKSAPHQKRRLRAPFLLVRQPSHNDWLATINPE